MGLLGELEILAKRFAPFAATNDQIARIHLRPEKIENLASELARIPEFANLKDGRFSNWTASGPFDLITAANALAKRIFEGVSGSDALHDLKDLVLKRKADVYIAMGIEGVTVRDATDLCNGVSIMPPDRLPKVKLREEMFDIDQSGKAIFRGLRARTPKASLLIKEAMTVIHDSTFDDYERRDLAEIITQKKSRALASLTLSGPECAPFVVSEGSWIDHPSYPYLGFGVE